LANCTRDTPGAAAMRAIQAIIHKNYNANEANDLYEQVIAGKA
jgi:hypothetical protein